MTFLTAALIVHRHSLTDLSPDLQIVSYFVGVLQAYLASHLIVRFGREEALDSKISNLDLYLCYISTITTPPNFVISLIYVSCIITKSNCKDAHNNLLLFYYTFLSTLRYTSERFVCRLRNI